MMTQELNFKIFGKCGDDSWVIEHFKFLMNFPSFRIKQRFFCWTKNFKAPNTRPNLVHFHLLEKKKTKKKLTLFCLSAASENKSMNHPPSIVSDFDIVFFADVVSAKAYEKAHIFTIEQRHKQYTIMENLRH